VAAGRIGFNQYRIVITELPSGGHGCESGTEGVAHHLTSKFISQI
jgi:succinate-semialdehyde dehydrogenase/glutarate-semialdehyde dehydrogenase